MNEYETISTDNGKHNVLNSLCGKDLVDDYTTNINVNTITTMYYYSIVQ